MNFLIIDYKIVDLKGKTVAAYVNRKIDKGNNEIQLSLNENVASGKYIATVTNYSLQRSVPFVLIK